MKVRIGPYRSWWGPYQLAEFLCFWAKDEKDEYGIPRKPDWVHHFGEWLAHGEVLPDPEVGEISKSSRDRKITWLYKFLLWIDKKKPKRVIKVHLDPWDTWSADHTMACIILPILKKLKEDKMGAPHVDDEDVPEELRSTSAPPKKNDWDTDDNHFKRWDWVLDEMIFAFETKAGDLQDWEDQFHTGNIDFNFVKQEDGNFRMERGPNDTSKHDWDGQKAYQERISNGFRLFGKYYEGLWR